MRDDIEKRMARIPLEVFNQGRIDLIDDLIHANYVEHDTAPGVPPTRAGFEMVVRAIRTAFPDFKYSVEDAIVEGDKVVHRLTASGTMRGELFGMPPTGRHATWNEVHIERVADGKLAEHWAVVDQFGMLVQLGVIPAPGAVPV